MRSNGIRYLYFLLPLAVVLANCSSDGQTGYVAGVADSTLLQFSVTTDGTRSSEPFTNVADFATEGRQFRVSAWQYRADGNGGARDAETVLSYFGSTLQDAVITRTDGEWTNDHDYYWPQPSYTVDFFAVYPSTQDITPDATSPDNRKPKTTTYTTADGATDLLYATYTGKRTTLEPYKWPQYGEPIYQTAPLTFHHALSQIHFQAKRTDDRFAVTVRSIEICNVKSSETFTFPMTATGSDHTQDNGTWATNGTQKANYPATMLANEIKLTDKDRVYPLTDTAHPLMLIPQTLTPWNPEDAAALGTSGAAATQTGCYLKIGCSIIMEGLDYAYSDGYIYVPCTNNQNPWQPGMSYTYCLAFGSGYDSEGRPTIIEVKVTGTITDWQDVSTTDPDTGYL